MKNLGPQKFINVKILFLNSYLIGHYQIFKFFQIFLSGTLEESMLIDSIQSFHLYMNVTYVLKL